MFTLYVKNSVPTPCGQTSSKLSLFPGFATLRRRANFLSASRNVLRTLDALVFTAKPFKLRIERLLAVQFG